MNTQQNEERLQDAKALQEKAKSAHELNNAALARTDAEESLLHTEAQIEANSFGEGMLVRIEGVDTLQGYVLVERDSAAHHEYRKQTSGKAADGTPVVRPTAPPVAGTVLIAEDHKALADTAAYLPTPADNAEAIQQINELNAAGRTPEGREAATKAINEINSAARTPAGSEAAIKQINDINTSAKKGTSK